MNKEQLEKIIKEEGNEYDFESEDLNCHLRRNGEFGHWCGYVSVPKDSKLHEKHYYTTSKSELGISKTEQAINNISIHGGLTYAGNRKNNEVWYFGFDTGHLGDLLHYMLQYDFAKNDIYRDKNYVIKECKDLAKQLKNILEN